LEDRNKIQTHTNKLLVGFAGSAADCLTLIEDFEQIVSKFQGFELLKPCVELAKKWRTNREYKSLSGVLLIGGKDGIVEIDSNGNVLLFDEIRSVGSGGIFAEAAAEMLYKHTQMNCQEIAEESMGYAAGKCAHSNSNFVKHRLVWD
jgi:ATP-dependent HslUV protease subunit HslV